MDEYLNDDDEYISMDSDLSFRGFMKKNLFDILDNDKKINTENIYFPDPKNIDRIGDLIKELGGVEICILL